MPALMNDACKFGERPLGCAAPVLTLIEDNVLPDSSVCRTRPGISASNSGNRMVPPTTVPPAKCRCHAVSWRKQDPPMSVARRSLWWSAMVVEG